MAMLTENVKDSKSPIQSDMAKSPLDVDQPSNFAERSWWISNIYMCMLTLIVEN
jgi:hypothetical protein